jgi:hypothetical protein
MSTIPIRDVKIGYVSWTQSDTVAVCYGFTIGPQRGTQWISILYGTEAEAEAARKAVVEALRDAVEVVRPD